MGDTLSTPQQRVSPEFPPLPEQISRRLERCQTLPSIPDAVYRVLSVARRPDASLSDYASAVERDPALTLRLLSLANSAFYARHSRVTQTCQEAVARIGLDATVAAVMSFGLASFCEHDRSLQHVWQRAIVAAIAARQLALRLCPEHAGALFTAALLQDIGILAMRSMADEALEIHSAPAVSHQEMSQREVRMVGCDHSLVGAWLAINWGMPRHLAWAIANSHGPTDTQDRFLLSLRLSGLVADAWISREPEHGFAGLIKQLNRLRISDASISLHELIEGIEGHLPSLSELVNVTAPTIHDKARLLAEAQQYLYLQSLALSARLDSQEQEIAALKQRQDELEHHSRTDPLTGLANRQWLETQLDMRFQRCVREQRTLSVAFIDLDHFKSLNDQHGHQFGDLILSRFATLLESTLRSGDLAGRYGGEEFLVILPDETSRGARCMARRLENALMDTPLATVDHVPLHISVSIGIASLEARNFADPRELIDAADKSMYRVKRTGRGGTAVYDEPGQ